MKRRQVGGEKALELSRFVAETLGLHFPRERHDELQRATRQAACELGVDYPRWPLLMPSTQDQLDVLASHLTIGETYFFRDANAMQALAGSVLTQLIAARRQEGSRRLRIWSAGCCTGEEPYSVAMLLHQALPDLADWDVSITATDLNLRFLRKAEAGVYGEWSFRGVARATRERYFAATADRRFRIAPHIRSMVNFRQLNLVDESYPSPRTDTHSMDLILCRNVLMYFAEDPMRAVAAKFRQALVDGGWLVVAPYEVSQSVFREFATVNFPDAIFYRKQRAVPQPPVQRGVSADPAWLAAVAPVVPFTPSAAVAPLARDIDVPARRSPAPALEWATLARTRANEGRHGDALALCERWIGVDKLNANAHYLRGVILAEQGEITQARSSLLRAIYLQPDFVLAHFAVGNLARAAGRVAEAARYLGNTQDLLSRCENDELVPESGGLTAAELALSIASLKYAGGIDA